MEKLTGKDLNGNTFRIGDSVLLPTPQPGDKYKKECVGVASKFHNGSLMSVVTDDGIVKILQTRVESLPAGY